MTQATPFGLRAWCIAATGLVVVTAHAAPLALTDPPSPGGDTLWCGAYLGQSPLQRRDTAPEGGLDGKRFGSDEASDIVDGHSFGFIDIGLQGHAVRLFAVDGADLMLGGEFASDSLPRTTLRMSRPVVTSVSDARGEGESTIDATATFRLARGDQAREFKGFVACSVHDVESFVANLCDHAPASKRAACAALKKTLLPPAVP